MMYKGSAPIFVTCKLPDLEWLEYWAQINPQTGKPWDSDASMLVRRMKVYRFTEPTPSNGQFPFCAHCFATYVKAQAAARPAAPAAPAE